MKLSKVIFGIIFGIGFLGGQAVAQDAKVVKKRGSTEATISSRPVTKAIKFEELPAPVQKAFKAQYGKATPKEVYYVKEQGKELYRVSVMNAADTILEIDFDATGKVVRETKKAKVEKGVKSTE